MTSIRNKRVWTGVPQSTHVTTRKSRKTPTATGKLEHKKSKATSSVLLSKMTVKLEITLSTTLKTRTKHKSQFSSHLAEKESAEYYALIMFLLLCGCQCSGLLPRSTVGWSVLCVCGMIIPTYWEGGLQSQKNDFSLFYQNSLWPSPHRLQIITWNFG